MTFLRISAAFAFVLTIFFCSCGKDPDKCEQDLTGEYCFELGSSPLYGANVTFYFFIEDVTTGEIIQGTKHINWKAGNDYCTDIPVDSAGGIRIIRLNYAAIESLSDSLTIIDTVKFCETTKKVIP